MLWPIRRPWISRRTAGWRDRGAFSGFAWDVPAIPVHHMEGHLLAPCWKITHRNFRLWRCWFPAVNAVNQRDWHWSVRAARRVYRDAAGEAFDKTAKLLGLDYPGGHYCRKWRLRVQPGALSSRADDRPSRAGFQLFWSENLRGNTIRDNGTDDQTRADIARALKMRWSIR